MKQGLLWRIGLTLCILVAAVIYLLPTLLPQPSDDREPSALQRVLPDSRVNLGLDLMGGLNLTLGVDVAKAMENIFVMTGQELMREANSKGILMTRPNLVPISGDLEFTLTAPAKQKDLEALMAETFQYIEVVSVTPAANGRLQYLIDMSEKARFDHSNKIVDQALNTIRNRIDQFGVAEPDIRKLEGGRIGIQLPGMTDPQRAIDIIGRTAHLEFRLVRDDVDPSARLLPRNAERFFMDDSKDSNMTGKSLIVDSQPVMSGEHIKNTAVDFGEYGEPTVSMQFNREGTRIFSRVTGDNVGKRLAIVLDGKIHSAPKINQKIEGNASISGQFTSAEASDLAVILRAGSLPAPVVVLEQRTVGPSLGQESIDMGITAALAGGALVVFFMAVYYGWSGIIANMMIILDVVLILAGMAAFGATLTLPGIAGIVLTLGMAVDANVLIFERIREEMRKGMTPLAAVEAGFSRAMLAITDSNLTTIIAAVILYQFGTGPIRGFAVTLTLGIVASMFTAIFVSRIVFDVWMKKPGRKLSI